MRDLPNMLIAGGLGLLAASLAIVLPVAALIWWIEDRFGSQIAGAVLIGSAALVGVVIGHWMTHRTAKAQASINSDIVHDTIGAVNKMAHVQREYARAERDAMAANTRRDQIDEQRVWRLAEQQRRLLSAPAKVDEAQPENMPWMIVDEDSPANGLNYVE